MAQNMSLQDARVRRTLAILFLVVAAVLALAVQGVGAYVAAAVLATLGIVFIVTAQVRTCPLYMPFKFSTNK